MQARNQSVFLIFFATEILFGGSARGESPILDDAATIARFRVAYKDGKVKQSEARRFNLDYELEGVDSEKLDRVELWGTNDLGLTWKRWGSDPDRVSPAEVETIGNGVYGIPRLKGADEQPTPKRGQDADIWVNVEDSTSILTNLWGYDLELKVLEKSDAKLATMPAEASLVTNGWTARIERRRWRFFRRRF
ncbi:MAG: hypothetical protein K8R36_24335 [Planctomycetales bacterium]|nr:hypothetical protein [Planctomycetales bacterium]